MTVTGERIVLSNIPIVLLLLPRVTTERNARRRRRRKERRRNEVLLVAPTVLAVVRNPKVGKALLLTQPLFVYYALWS